MKRLHDASRASGEHIEYRCTAAYDNPAQIAAAVAKSNQFAEPIKIRESVSA